MTEVSGGRRSISRQLAAEGLIAYNGYTLIVDVCGLVELLLELGVLDDGPVRMQVSEGPGHRTTGAAAAALTGPRQGAGQSC